MSRRLKNGKWLGAYRAADKKEHTKCFARKVDADRWEVEQKSLIQRGEWVDPALGRVTVGEWADRWLSGKANLKPTTRDRYAGILATHFRPSWGEVRLDAVTHDGVQAWVAGLLAAGQ